MTDDTVCKCCHVHTTWRERPIPKQEVTIEMIGALNKQYRDLFNQIQELKKETV